MARTEAQRAASRANLAKARAARQAAGTTRVKKAPRTGTYATRVKKVVAQADWEHRLRSSPPRGVPMRVIKSSVRISQGIYALNAKKKGK